MKTEKTYARFGRASLQSGLQHAIDVLQAEIDSLKEQIAGDVAVEDEPPRRIAAKAVVRTKDGWMEERRLPSGRLSTSGLIRGTKKWRLIDAFNKRVRRDEEIETEGRRERANSARRRYENWSPAQRKRWQQAMRAGRERAAQQRANGAAV